MAKDMHGAGLLFTTEASPARGPMLPLYADDLSADTKLPWVVRQMEHGSPLGVLLVPMVSTPLVSQSPQSWGVVHISEDPVGGCGETDDERREKHQQWKR